MIIDYFVLDHKHHLIEPYRKNILFYFEFNQLILEHQIIVYKLYYLVKFLLHQYRMILPFKMFLFTYFELFDYFDHEKYFLFSRCLATLSIPLNHLIYRCCFFFLEVIYSHIMVALN